MHIELQKDIEQKRSEYQLAKEKIDKQNNNVKSQLDKELTNAIKSNVKRILSCLNLETDSANPQEFTIGKRCLFREYYIRTNSDCGGYYTEDKWVTYTYPDHLFPEKITTDLKDGSLFVRENYDNEKYVYRLVTLAKIAEQKAKQEKKKKQEEELQEKKKKREEELQAKAEKLKKTLIDGGKTLSKYSWYAFCVAFNVCSAAGIIYLLYSYISG